MKTAITTGWKYQLIGVNFNKTVDLRFHDKWAALNAAVDNLPNDVVIVFVDAMDVTFQITPSQFHKIYLDYVQEKSIQFKDNNEYDPTGKIIFNAENNCWPFKRHNSIYRCRESEGYDFYNAKEVNSFAIFYQHDIKHEPVGCFLQLDKPLKGSRKFLNAGALVGFSKVNTRLVASNTTNNIIRIIKLC